MMRANSQLVTNIIIGPLFENIALSKFILNLTGQKLCLSESLAGPQVFYHTIRSGAGTFFTFENGLLCPGGTIGPLNLGVNSPAFEQPDPEIFN